MSMPENPRASRSSGSQQYSIQFQRGALEKQQRNRFSCHCIVLIALRGSATLEINHQQHVINDSELGCFLGIHPYRLTDVSDDNEFVRIEIPHATIFNLNDTPNIQQQLHAGEPLIAEKGLPLNSAQLEQWQTDASHADHRIQAMFHDEFLLFLRRTLLLAQPKSSTNFKPGSQQRRHHVNRMIAYISQNYCERVRIVDITSSIGLEKCYAMKLFKQQMGVSMLDYMTTLRLNHAVHLLLHSQSTIIEVAFDSGFSSLSRFYEIFSERMGISPLAFRNSGTAN